MTIYFTSTLSLPLKNISHKRRLKKDFYCVLQQYQIIHCRAELYRLRWVPVHPHQNKNSVLIIRFLPYKSEGQQQNHGQCTPSIQLQLDPLTVLLSFCSSHGHKFLFCWKVIIVRGKAQPEEKCISSPRENVYNCKIRNTL